MAHRTIENEVCDLIIVGAGSSGCALANRLSAEGTKRMADCSVMPSLLVSGNNSGPAMALGWRAADLILADDRNLQ